MKRRRFWVSVLVWLFLPSMLFGGEAGNTGIVKGTITIGGKPAPDAVVSVEGILSGQLKTQNY